MGHNGSGKTTLLRVLCGIYPPTSGIVSIEGRVNALINIMFGVDYESSGRENIKLRGLLMGLSRRRINDIIDEVVDFSELNDFIDLPMRTYSSGMALRLAFAVATSIDTDILVLDEWLSVGDQEFTQKAEERLIGLISKAKILVIASHNEHLIDRTCTRKIMLEHGAITGEEKC